MSSSERLVDRIRRWAQQRPEAPAVIDRESTLTWSTFADAITSGAARLARQGISRGDHVVLDADRSTGFAVAYYAAHAVGATAVIGGPANSDHAHGDDEIADIVYTTGTTGEPKGVVLTHANIATIAANLVTYFGQHEGDVELCTLPLAHSFGLGRLRAMAHAGSTLVVDPGLRAIGDLFAVAHARHVTCLSLAPAGLAMMRRMRADRDLAGLAPALRFVELGSAPISAEVRAWTVDRLAGVRVGHHYGLTEASRAAFVELAADDARDGSIGRPLPGVTIEIRDATGAPGPANCEGELWIRGAIVARGYWGLPELTAATFVDGAVRTDDLGLIDDTGRVFLRGRRSELVNVGGIKVAPEQVEAVLRGHPDVIDVACTGIDDPSGITGQRVAAFVVATRDVSLAELRAWATSHGLDSHHAPAHVERVVELPRGPSGKVLRRALTRSR